MNRSESIEQLAGALVRFQGQIGKIKKDSKNPFFKSTYASLSTILDSIQEPLAECNLAVVQFPSGNYGLTTILMHHSGQFLEESFEMRPAKDDPQGRGSCITYQRRYALGAILGLNIDVDDDGNAASEPKPVQKIVKKPVEEKETLLIGTTVFEQVKKRLIDKSATIEQVEKHFNLTDAARLALKDYIE